MTDATSVALVEESSSGFLAVTECPHGCPWRVPHEPGWQKALSAHNRAHEDAKKETK